MGVPATTGVLRTKIIDMAIGDYIVCNYQAASGAVGTFSNFGGTVGAEIPVLASATPNGSFYLVKIEKGLLCSDRVVQFSITWDVLNTGKLIQGKPQTFDAVNGIIRSLTGGVAYADANGNSSTTDQSKGAFPTNNEWDKYIVNFKADKIQAGKTLDDVFHWSGIATTCQDTTVIAIGASTQRTYRGNTPSVNRYITNLSTTNGTAYGFRPVFAYKE